MRPNVDIPWSIHGRIKEYAQTTDITIEEAYIETLNAGTDQLPIPEDADGASLNKKRDKHPFGPWKVPSQGEESIDINKVTTCFPHFYQPDTPVVVRTGRQNISAEKLESLLASFQANTRVTGDWFTIHQLGGAWVGRGAANFAHGMSTAGDLFAGADFPLYKKGSAVYIASLARENDYLFLRANLSRREGRISNLSLTFFLDGYPVTGREYQKIASRLGFSQLLNAREHYLPSLHRQFGDPPEVEVVEEITEDESNHEDPWVSGIIIENPYQHDADLIKGSKWRQIPDDDHQTEAKNQTEALSNYDHLYCELDQRHPVSENKEYYLEAISATYLSTLLRRNSIWNITPSVDWW